MPDKTLSPDAGGEGRNPHSNSFGIGLSKKTFDRIRSVVLREIGIDLHTGKEELVKSRLMKRLRVLGMSSFNEYIDLVEQDMTGAERLTMIDCITTNKTSFFREPRHFEFLLKNAMPGIGNRKAGGGRKLRVWSAGCSSGEEPYSLAIFLREGIPEIGRWDIRILATDISTRMLARAREARYRQDFLNDVPPLLLQKYFTCVEAQPPREYAVKPEISGMVTLARLNLMDEWPMTGPFDVIFCRNVMIYFDKSIQQQLVERFWRILSPGGHLFVGHSESMTGLTHDFRYVEPAVYVK